MITLEELKRSLGTAAERYSDDELLDTLERMDRLADILFESWLRKRKRLRDAER